MASWLNFILVGEKPKTKIWNVESLDGKILGQVKWFASWRGYAFFPEVNTIFEKTCLRDIADFTEKQTIDHKNS